ncbi:zinc finger Y-chromosomal protein 1-like [Tribolium madens]|uniref:zinc finger Y-chromosomal protein 1-like n=1 Tax=Tribolium madens TaxID=41895 RepID=UPI001CF746C9|nr:zinc finger Y-chromosomal protein 1-like [Tribolium madens]
MFSTNLSPIKVEVEEEIFDRLRLYYGCEKCSFKTKLLSRIRTHARIHENTEQKFNCFSGGLENYKCHKCKTFETQFLSQLRCHIVQGHTSQHVEPKTFKCHKCDFNSFSQLLVMRHSFFTKHQRKSVFKCTDCDFETRVLSNLRRHVMCKHTDDSAIQWFKCKHCSYKCKLKHDLKRHMIKKHDPPNFPYLCELCDYKAKLNYDLQRHVNARHKPKNNKTLTSSIVKCTFCDYKTMYSGDLKKHMIFRHTNDSEIQWFKCDHCSFKCKLKSGLKQHMILKHDPPNFRYSCKICDYKTKLNSNLKRHVNARH